MSNFLQTLLFTTVLGANLPPISFQLPWDENYFTQTVASVQNTYCDANCNQEGQQIGDQILRKSIMWPDGSQRANVYLSQSLGIILAYQGTNATNLNSIWHDVTILPVMPDSRLGLNNPDAFVYSGFQDQFQKTWDQVEDALGDLLSENPGVRVQVTGHSQGAAIAQLGALAIRHKFGDVIDRIMCYGPPRVGNDAYAHSFDSYFRGRYTGITNGQDWVYTVPPSYMGYRHPSGMVWINPANTTNWSYFSDSEDPRGPDAQYPTYFNLHSLESFPFMFFGDHEGIYMHSRLGTRQNGPCPARAGGY